MPIIILLGAPPPMGSDGIPLPDDDGGRGGRMDPPPELLGRGRGALGRVVFRRRGALARSRPPSLVVRRRLRVVTVRFLLILFPRL